MVPACLILLLCDFWLMAINSTEKKSVIIQSTYHCIDSCIVFLAT